MTPNQKSFLDGLAELCRVNNVDVIEADYSCVRVASNNQVFSFRRFVRIGKETFEGVVTSEEYVPESPPERYTGEEFDD